MLTLKASVVVLLLLDNDLCESSSIAKAEFFGEGETCLIENRTCLGINHSKVHSAHTHLWLHVTGGRFIFITWLLVLQNHTADTIFDFLTALSIGETFIVFTYRYSNKRQWSFDIGLDDMVRWLPNIL